MGIYFMGIREQRSKTEEDRGTKAVLGNRKHRKSRFGGTRQFIFGEQGNMYSPGRASLMLILEANDAWCIFLYGISCIF